MSRYWFGSLRMRINAIPHSINIFYTTTLFYIVPSLFVFAKRRQSSFIFRLSHYKFNFKLTDHIFPFTLLWRQSHLYISALSIKRAKRNQISPSIKRAFSLSKKKNTTYNRVTFALFLDAPNHLRQDAKPHVIIIRIM